MTWKRAMKGGRAFSLLKPSKFSKRFQMFVNLPNTCLESHVARPKGAAGNVEEKSGT